ncbi:hypothetical protein BXY39_1598 [Eilatimonas milleporae]|uniref:Uncharacterized protein n=1 Tax=Eilatimonas milleporae TaxID=911205 RepID=A0A3M0CH60_9PROT|nr:hypothetical protein BXY39_1598 [Eilatimonas milleporae]
MQWPDVRKVAPGPFLLTGISMQRSQSKAVDNPALEHFESTSAPKP